MSLGFKKNGDLEDKPDGYFNGTRHIASYEYEIKYKGMATEATGKKWINAIAGVCITGFFSIIILIIFLMDLNIPTYVFVLLALWAAPQFLIALVNLLRCSAKIKEEIRLGLGEKERQSIYEEGVEEESKIRIKQEQWDGGKISENCSEASAPGGKNGMLILMALFAIIVTVVVVGTFLWLVWDAHS